MTTIKTTWGKVFENIDIILLNAYPEILQKMGAFEELAQWGDYNEETGEYDEIYQWFILGDDYDAEWLERFCPDIASDIHYSETLGHYMMAVRHLGTGWSYVPTELQVDDEEEDLAKIYQKTYHDELRDDVLRNVFGEKTIEDIAYDL